MSEKKLKESQLEKDSTSKTMMPSISDPKTKEPIRFSASLFKVDIPTINGNIYSKDAIEAAISDPDFQSRLKAGEVIGTFDDPQTMFTIRMGGEVKPALISHKLDEVVLSEDGVLSATVSVLDTPKGRSLVNAIRVMEKIGDRKQFNLTLVPDGVGKVGEDKRVKEYKMMGIHVVPELTAASPAPLGAGIADEVDAEKWMEIPEADFRATVISRIEFLELGLSNITHSLRTLSDIVVKLKEKIDGGSKPSE